MTKVNSITIDTNCFSNNITINSVDLGNAKWTNNAMSDSFAYCSSLTSVNNINENVTNIWGTFASCTSLVNAPTIPNSVIDMRATFSGCTSLVNAPIIPNSVTNMNWTFYGCLNISGNIYINSNQISDAQSCFGSSSKTKNVYIPFKYENGVYTTTYNSFISAGYDENGTQEGVYLKDINIKQYTLTINPTPTDATVTLTAEGFVQEGNSITVNENTLVEYTVSKDGYVTQSGSKTLTSNLSLDITLEEQGGFDPSALKYGDRLGDGEGVATVVGDYTDSNGQKYKFAVLDAKYMNKLFWSTGYTDTGLPNYTSDSDVLNAKESATYNTDYILNNYTASSYPAFNHCNNALSIDLGGTVYRPKLPNAYELQQIFDNRSDLYSKDPTRSSYTAYNLASWSFNSAPWAWCSNEYFSILAWSLYSDGSWGSDRKGYDYGVVPVLEIEIP